jgi:uncharacterized RDD family membrane protein YckC
MTKHAASLNPENKKPVAYASFNRRVIALSVDITLATIILIPFSGILSFLIYGGETADVVLKKILADQQGLSISAFDVFSKLYQANIIQKFFFLQFLGFVLIGFLFVGSWIKMGTTPGKWIAECKILDEKTLSEPSRFQYVMRYLAFIPSNIIGFFLLEWDKKNRAWHDRMVGTVVVVKKHNWDKISKILAAWWQKTKSLMLNWYSSTAKKYTQGISKTGKE